MHLKPRHINLLKRGAAVAARVGTLYGLLWIAYFLLGHWWQHHALQAFLATLFLGTSPLLYFLAVGLSELVILEILESRFVGTKVDVEWEDNEVKVLVSTKYSPVKIRSARLELEAQLGEMQQDPLHPRVPGYPVLYKEVVEAVELLTTETATVHPGCRVVLSAPLPRPQVLEDMPRSSRGSEWRFNSQVPLTAYNAWLAGGVYRLVLELEDSFEPIQRWERELRL